MLVRPHDAATDAECRMLLAKNDFGQLIAPGVGRDLPVVVPTHFIFDGDADIALHLARNNPIWGAIDENPLVMFTIISDWTYIDTRTNAAPGDDPDYGTATSYYASVQLTCRAEVMVEPEQVADVLMHQLRHFQPEGGHAVVQPGPNPYGKQLRAIRALVLHVESMVGKLKFGGNKTPEHRTLIESTLRDRNGPGDLAAADHMARRATEA